MLLKYKQLIVSIIVGRFRYKYEYVSPFGEYWSVYRLWFGFIPIEYKAVVNEDMFDTSNIEEYVNSLNSTLIIDK